MGAGRILNNHIREYFHKLEENKYQGVNEKDPYVQRMYRTHNIAYPDILYEKLPYPQEKVPTSMTFINKPIPPSDATRTQLTFAEPSNIITDNIMYEEGVPGIREDYRLTKELRRGQAGNILVTTEYAPGISEKIRKDNPVVVSTLPEPGPNGKTVKRLHRLKPPEKPHARRFNIDYDEYGQPLQKAKAVYDTMDYLGDLKLTNEDYGEGEVGSKITDESLKVWEDFITTGRLRQGYEIITSED